MVIAEKYLVQTEIARGGMGRVYVAEHVPLGRSVALKILHVDELSLLDAADRERSATDLRKRFFREAASCAQLVHPNIVTIFDYGDVDDNDCFIAMELLHGETLADLIRREGRLDEHLVVTLAKQICSALSLAHRSGMTHRDLKPSNIMLTKNPVTQDESDAPPVVKVLDFGLVKREQDDHDLTHSGALIGTPKYMPPEQIAGINIGPHSDVYALGAVMYHALAGKPPFEGESKYALLAAHINLEPPAIKDVCDADVVGVLESIVQKCLRKAPESRYASMDDLADALSVCFDPDAADKLVFHSSHSGVSRSSVRPIAGSVEAVEDDETIAAKVTPELARDARIVSGTPPKRERSEAGILPTPADQPAAVPLPSGVSSNDGSDADAVPYKPAHFGTAIATIVALLLIWFAYRSLEPSRTSVPERALATTSAPETVSESGMATPMTPMISSVADMTTIETETETETATSSEATPETTRVTMMRAPLRQRTRVRRETTEMQLVDPTPAPVTVAPDIEVAREQPVPEPPPTPRERPTWRVEDNLDPFGDEP